MPQPIKNLFWLTDYEFISEIETRIDLRPLSPLENAFLSRLSKKVKVKRVFCKKAKKYALFRYT